MGFFGGCDKEQNRIEELEAENRNLQAEVGQLRREKATLEDEKQERMCSEEDTAQDEIIQLLLKSYKSGVTFTRTIMESAVEQLLDASETNAKTSKRIDTVQSD